MELAAAQMTRQMEAPMYAPRGPKGAPVEGENGNWRCIACNNVNFASRTTCNRCQAVKPDPETLAAAQAAALAAGPEAAYAPHQRPAKGGPPVEGEGGNWKCLMCGNVNFVQRMKCHRCQSDKALSVVDPSALAANPMAMMGYGAAGSGAAGMGFDLNSMAQLQQAALLGTDQAAAASMGMVSGQDAMATQIVAEKVAQMEQRQNTMAITVSALQQQVQQLQKQLTEQAFQLATQANVTSTLALKANESEAVADETAGGSVLGKRSSSADPNGGSNVAPALR